MSDWSSDVCSSDLLGDHGGEPQRLFAKLLADEDDRVAVLDADVEVEDRQVEVKGRMGRKTILRPRREFVRAPVHEAERRAVAVHDPLWATGGAGGIEDIVKRLLAGRGRAVADRPQQHQLLAELLKSGRAHV